ncbi:hypothetical protein [Planctomicrobium piriforme]|nr:hypothetical protein [Planctomicrobium piriforme]
MSLCSLGTTESVEALRKLVRVTEYPRLALAAAYSLAWHHVHDGIDVMFDEYSRSPSEKRLIPALFLTMCHHRQACEFLKGALSDGLGPSWPVSRILLAAEMNVRRRRPTGTLQQEEMLTWLNRMNDV